MSEFDITKVRRIYAGTQLNEADILRDPVEQLREWIEQAHDVGALEPNAMCLSTMGETYPTGRIVLLRGLDDRGLIFFTSYFSRKGRELEALPRAGATFYWPQLARQVRVEGDVEPLPDDDSDAYFNSRPRGHQIGAWASEQSEPVESREILDQRTLDYAQRFEGEDVPRPHSWGGYILYPQRIEFWQGRANRMHDRLQFTRTAGGWSMQRLQP